MINDRVIANETPKQKEGTITDSTVKEIVINQQAELFQKFRVQQVIKIKLEIMPLPVLKFLMNFVFFIGVLGLVTPLLMAIATAYVATWGFSDSGDTVKSINGGQEAIEYTKAIFGVEGALRSVSCLVVFFLLISYPLRILIHFCRVREKVVNEQFVIACLIVIYSIAPLYSLYQIVTYWMMFSQVIAGLNTENVNQVVGKLFNALHNMARVSFAYSSLLTAFVVSMTFFFWGVLIHFQGIERRD
jgi:hypothetical protein